MCSSQHQVSNSAKLAHSRSNLPFSRSQLKLPLLLEVAGDSALSGVWPRELLAPSNSSGVCACKSKQRFKGGVFGPAAMCLCNSGGRQKHGNNDILENLRRQKIIRNRYCYCSIYAIFSPLNIPSLASLWGLIFSANE